jgi:hypothetical protein
MGLVESVLTTGSVEQIQLETGHLIGPVKILDLSKPVKKI